MRTKEDKNVGIFRIRKEINPIYDTGQKENTIIEQLQIYWNTENIRQTERNTDQCCIEKDSGTNINRLFESGAFWGFYFEECRSFYDVQRGYDFRQEKHKNPYYNRHFYIPVKKEKNSHKNSMDERCEKEHEKIIPSRQELQETI
jgi:hypothetical protein